MAHLLRDDRKNAIQAFMAVPGSAVDVAVTTSDDEVFTPDLSDGPKSFLGRSTVKVRIVAHNADHEFDAATEPPMESLEEQIFTLDGVRRDRITMRSVAASGTVTFVEIADD